MNTANHMQTLMIVAGMGLLCWLIMRGRIKTRARTMPSMAVSSMKHNANVKSVPSAFSGVASVGAPPEVLKWQVEMYDLARQLKAELDSKIVAVNKLTTDYNRAAERLNSLIAEARSLAARPPAQEIPQRLLAAGCTLQQVSIALSISEDQLQTWLNAKQG